MFCKSCGKQISDSAKFCDRCGAPQQKQGIKPVTVVLIIVLVAVIFALACGVGYLAALGIASSQTPGNPRPGISLLPTAEATQPVPEHSTAPAVNPYLAYGSPMLSDSDRRYLIADDLEQLSATELVLARSEILARHGVMFNDSDLSAYFEAQGWYQKAIAEKDFDSTALSDFEAANMQLITLYEKIVNGDYAPSANNPYMPYYDPSVELLVPKSSNTKLTTGDLIGLNADQLLLLRNQIIALHGYAFDDQHLMEYFLQCSWYRPSTPPGRTDLVKGMTGLEYENMTFIFQFEQNPMTQAVDPAILGTWCSGYGGYNEDGLFGVCFGDFWHFQADGTFTCTETESLYFYNPDGTENGILGAGALDSKGTFSFDGTYLTITTTHAFESSSGPYIKLDSPKVTHASITYDGDTLLVNWGNRVERFYRETSDALVKRLMQETQP